MLWMKYWMETRWKFLLACSVCVVLLWIGYVQSRQTPVPVAQRIQATSGFFSLFLLMQAVILGGAGIKTQAPFRTSKGIHGSIHFTLSLPVSRLRLLATRTSMGLIELTSAILAGSVALAVMLPSQYPELQFSMSNLALYVLTLFACLAACFSLSTLLSTFLDDVWQAWGSLMLIVGVRVLATLVPLPEKMDPFRALTSASPFMTQGVPWGAIVISLLLAAVLLTATAKFVQRDY